MAAHTVFVDRRIVVVAGGDERPAGGPVEVGAAMVLKKNQTKHMLSIIDPLTEKKKREDDPTRQLM